MNYLLRLCDEVVRIKNRAIKDIGGDSIHLGFAFLLMIVFLFTELGFNGYLAPSLWLLALLIIKHLFSTAMKMADHGL